MIFTAGQIRKADANIPARSPDESEISAHALSPAKHRPRKRDLTKAVTLRPSEVTALYGISQPVLSRLLNHDDPKVRLPSLLIPGRSGRKGVRLIKQADLIAYLDRHLQ